MTAILEIDARSESVYSVPSIEPDNDQQVSIRLTDGEEVTFRWGRRFKIGSTAYWIDQAKRLPQNESFRIGNSLGEEVVFCILGGFGIPAETGVAAFEHLKAAGVLETDFVPNCTKVEMLLRQPIRCEATGKLIHYRFPRQKSRCICHALISIGAWESITDFRILRERLLTVPGIGMKTASWILRNYFDLESIAIVDVHVKRAGIAAGFFKPSWNLQADYDLYEASFVACAKLGGVKASILDVCIWEQMRAFGVKGRDFLFPRSRDQKL